MSAAPMHALNALPAISAQWTAFKLDPAWCMRYLELVSDFLTTHRTFTAELPLVHVIDAGLRTSEKLNDDCWCSGFDMLLRLGWIAPISQRLHGSKQWMSLL